MEKIESVILVCGPGGTAFSNSDITKFSSNLKDIGAAVTVVGNGVQKISMDLVKAVMSSVEGPMTIIVLTHGEDINGIPHLIFSEEQNTEKDPSLMSFISEIQKITINTHVDYLITSCNSGGIHYSNVSDLLLEDEILITLSSSNIYSGSVSSFDVKNFYLTLPESSKFYDNYGFGAYYLLQDYLLSDLHNRITPEITIGKQHYQLDELLKNTLSKQITISDEFSQIIQHFNETHVESISAKISTARSEYTISAVDYGTALAIALDAKISAGIISNAEHEEL